MSTFALARRQPLTLRSWLDNLVSSTFLPVAIALSLLINIGGFPLFDLDEGAFSAATMEMLKRGDFITTWLGGQLRFDKPILIYWLQALSVSLLGLNEFALRLPSALCSIGWIYAAWMFTRTYLTQSHAGSVIILLSSSVIFSVIARAATADALLNLFICLALFDAYRFFVASKPQKTFWGVDQISLRFYLWVGLGVLAKGPIAIFVPAASMMLFTAASNNWLRWRLLFINPVGWFICALVFLPWYVAEYMAQGQAFIDGFLLKHNLSRFSGTMEGHGGKWYYYIPVSLLVFMPASGWYLTNFKHVKFKGIPAFDRWCWSWFVVIFVFFSLSKTQLPHYLLYGATPIFILMSKYREKLRYPLLIALPSLLMLLPLALLKPISEYLIATSHDDVLVAMLNDGLIHISVVYQFIAAAVFLVILFLCFVKTIPLWQRQLISCTLFSLTFVFQIMPVYAAIQQGPVVAAAKFSESLSQNIVMYQHDMPSFSVHLNKVVEIREPRVGEVLFSDIKHIKQYKDASLLFQQGGIGLAQINSLDKFDSPEGALGSGGK